MNIFIITWNLAKEHQPVVLAELRRLKKEVYPLLDADTLWHQEVGDKAFAASIHTAEAVARPRCYVSRRGSQVTFFDGLPVDRTGRFQAFRAEELSAHWDELPQCLEGTFVAARLTTDPPQIELLTDPMGTETVFYLNQEDTWLVSNSVRLLERIGKVSALDPLGVSLLLTMGWVGADRTLRRDIRVLPGGQKVTWQHDQPCPRSTTYFQRADLVPKKRSRLTRPKVQRLAASLTQMCRSLSQDFGTLNCPLTAGHDTRLLASLLIHAGIPAQYFTFSSYLGSDVLIATQIAQAFGLEHRISDDPVEEYLISNSLPEKLVAQWDVLSQRYVREHDGLAGLEGIGSLVWTDVRRERLDRLGFYLNGSGGEIARSFWGSPSLFVRARTPTAMKEWFLRAFITDHQGVLTGEATRLARSYLQGFVEGCLDEGFAPLDLPDLFYAFERVRRWLGNAYRQGLMTADYFYPLCTRPFIETAFSLSALQRWSEPIHYQMIKYLVPELLHLPLEQPWRSQWPALNYVRNYVWFKIAPRLHWRLLNWLESRKPAPVHNSDYQNNMLTVLEAKREQIRQVCLDQSDSLVWSLVNRSKFERLLSPATDAEVRGHSWVVLFQIATVFCYAAEPAVANWAVRADSETGNGGPMKRFTPIC